MPRRIFESESDSPEESWRRIRALRATPPIGMPPSRRTLFTSSLEQAQQQFASASSVGFESRALNLYYGLSQAGRAIAAALTPEKIGKSPEVSGHGLRVVDLPASRAKSFWEIQVKAEGNDDTSYGRLASLLTSAPLAKPVSLAQIWHMIPELHLDYPVGRFIEPRWTHRPYDRGDVATSNTFTLQANEEEMRDDARKLRALYPDLQDTILRRYKGGSYSEKGGVRTDEAVFSHEGQTSPLRKLRGRTVLMPAVGSDPMALDPLLTWWILLYALSMITRYKPVLWTEIIDVNRSPLAVPIETLLSKALESVPAQIYSTLSGASVP